MKKPTFSKMTFKDLFLLLNSLKSDFILGCSRLKEIIFIKNDGGILSFFDSQYLRKAVLIPVFFILCTYASYSQVGKAFAPRLPGGNMRIKGDVIFVGNSMMSRTTTQPTFSAADPNGTPTNLTTLTAEANQNYNTPSNNNGLNQEYTDIDTDPTTFASSSAQLNINNSCKRVVYAGLYWTAIYPYERSTNSGSNTVGTPRLNDWNQIKFKVPGAANYTTLVADNVADAVGDEDDIIFDGYKAPPATSFTNAPYVCYKNVTGMLQLLTDPNGNYFAANIRAAKGKKSSGSMAGWTLVVVYESPTLPSRYISTFDGFAGITSALKNLDFTVNGFKALPAPLPVRATIGVAAQEGESRLYGDDLLIKANGVTAFTYVNNALNPLNNVFNSSITVPSATTPFSVNVGTRVPNSLNTLGFDMDLLNVDNPGNKVIPNGETGATYRLTSTSDTYAVYATTFAVDVIEPEIVLTKVVKNAAGTNIGNTNVTLGDFLNYEIGFKNVGNDDADSFTIKDILPVNIIFDPNNIVVPSGSGITYTYTAATRTLIFKVPNNLVKINGNQWIIKFGVQVVPNCNDLSDACADQIKNQAFGTYKGITNPSVITDDPSISVFGSCNLATPSATNFLVGVGGCKFTRKYQLCGKNVTISAANGYDKYSWSTSPSGSPVIGTTQSITVTNVGTYYVHNTALAPCVSIDETVTVEAFGSTTVNPVIPFADEVVNCANNSKPLPNIYLCGDNAKRYIRSGVTDTNSIIWEKSSCALVSGTTCADETNACTWTQVETGPDFNVGEQGQYRVTLNYTNGCFSRYFFNVYENKLNPTATSRDIICNTNGEIVVGTPAAGSGYEYSLDGTNYLPSNIFSIATPNIYTVYIRSTVNVPNRCVFTIPGIQIRKRDFTVTTTVNDPLCYGGKGSVKLAANDVRAQYYFSISKGGTPINSVGPIIPNDYTFSNLDPGTYDYRVRTDDGCDITGTVTLVEPATLKATADITKALTCESGEITVTPVGGTGPYTYFVNSTTDFQGSPIISITTAGTYTIKVVDFNNCEFTIAPITITNNPKPVYNPAGTNIKCYGSNTGEIKFNVTNANGYALSYSIDNGVTYFGSDTFSNLPAGTYDVMLKYSLGGVDCFDGPQTITITEPAAALTASAGVSELAGCGPAKEGKIRITNPQGGVAPYEYSFDNQASWSAVNDAYKAPGTYTVYIRDVIGCIYAMPGVVIDPEPVAPSIDVNTPVDFNCDGTATSKVIINNPGSASYSYDYYLDNVKNTNSPSNEFINVSPGSHSVRVEYKLTSVPTYSNLLNEDFGVGADVSSPGASTNFCFENQLGAGNCNGQPALYFGEYTVTNALIASSWWEWKPFPVDHSPGTTPKGRFFATDVGTVIKPNDICYKKTINDIIPNRDIQVEIWIRNLYAIGRSAAADPNLILDLEPVNGTLATALSIQETGNVPRTNDWVKYNMTLNPGNNTSLDFAIRIKNPGNSGIDFAFDDIKVFQLPKACITTKDFTIIVPTGKAFTGSITGYKDVKCNAGSDGEITIAAQNFGAGFDYSIDNGVTWITSPTSPVTIPNLAANTYLIKIRPDATSAVACTKPFTQVISAPVVIGATTAVTTLATCSTGATITTTATGGTPAYQYELRNAAGTVVVRAFQTSNLFTNVPTGSYTIFVRDTNLCSNTVGVPVTVVAPTAVTAVLAGTSDLCYDTVDQAKLVITATGTGTLTYSLDGQAAQNSNTFTNVAPGTHTILVTDSNNCTATISNIIIAPQLLPVASVTKTLDCSVNKNAEITVTINGGTGPFSYTVQKGAGTPVAISGTVPGPTFIYTVLPADADTYTFVVTDATLPTGCSASTKATVNALVPVTATTTDVNPTCNGGANGSVQIAASGGVGPYTYSFNGSGFTSNVSYAGLAAGTYPYVVTDSKNCTFSGSVILTAPVAISGVAVVIVPYTCLQNATIEAQTVSGGTGAYSYSINGTTFQASPIFTGLVNGTYTITIKDASGCTFVTPSVTIVPLTPPTDLTFSNTALMCPANTSDVTIATTVGGSGTKTYQITAPVGSATAYQSSTLFTGLASGTYTFQVKDDKDCTYQENFTINALPAVTVIGQLVNNVQCLGSSTGAVKYTVSGATNFTYTINGVAQGVGTSPINLTGLAAGNYAIVITNTDTNCTANTSVTVDAPTAVLAVNKTVTPIKCSTNGSVLVAATGGWGGYSYSLTQPDATVVGPQGSNSFTNLSQIGTYTISVTDANNCLVTDTFALTTPVQPVASIAGSDLCYDTTNQATLTVTASLGVSPYQYSIDNGATYQSSNSFPNLVPGNYSIIVKDAFGCTSTALAQTIDAQLKVNVVLTKDLDCNASPDAIITGTISGGKASYTVSIVSGSGTLTQPVGLGITFTYTTGTSGTNQFQVADANGCPVTSAVITINPIVLPTGTTNVTNLTCNGSANGSVTIIPSLGVGPYTFSFNGSAYTSNATYGGLAAGTYNYSIKDSKNCPFNSTVTVTEPTLIAFTPFITNMSCPPASVLGSVEVKSVTNGIAPFTYILTNTVTNATLTHNEPARADWIFSGLSFGNYSLTVTDSKGCSVTMTEDVLAPPTALTIDLSTPVGTCASGATIIVSVNPSPVPPGTPYTFGIYDMNVAPFSSALLPNDLGLPLQHTFNGLTPGVVYTFVIYDSITNCYYFQKAAGAIPPLTPLTSVIDVVKPVTCKGTATGTVSFTVSNYSGTDIHYEVFYDQTNISTGITGDILTAAPAVVTNFGAFTPGTYYIQFTENNGGNTGCVSASATFTITESATDFTPTASANKNDNCNHTGQISAIPHGGTPPYQYELVGPVNIAYSNYSTFPNPSSPLLLTTGNYTVNVKDANGCIVPLPVFLDIDTSPIINAVLSNQCTATEGNFVIDVTLAATPTGIPPYTYSIDGGVYQNLVAPFSITGLSSGSHTVQVKDANGCGNGLVTVPVLAPLGVSPTVSTIVTCPSGLGEITANATGGSGTYVYTISPAVGTLTGNVFKNLPPNTYTVTVTDGPCQVSKTVVLDAPTAVTFSTTATDVKCNGDSNGTITVTLPATNDNPTYTYEITAPIVVAAQNSNVFTGLAAGTYTIRVNSGKGCFATNTETVGTPLALLVDATSSVTAFGCAPDNSVNTATVTVVETAGTGTGPYTYSIDNSNFFTTNTFSIIDTGSPYNLDVYVKDNNGCIATDVIPITPLPKITAASASVNAAIDCNNTGSLIINVTGGSGNFTYQMLPGVATQPSNIFAVTTPGDYYFRVNDVITGCYFDTVAFTVVPFNTINVVATATTPVSCFGDSNGAIEINVSGYSSGTYNYEVFNSLGVSVRGPIAANTSTNPLPIIGLLADSYTVVVTETGTPYCVKTSNVVTVGSPSAAVSISATTVNDNCNVNAGQIVADAQGGTAPYLYQILPAATTAPLVTDPGWSSTKTLNAETGNYVIYVKDANDCPQSLPVFLDVDPSPIVAAVLNTQCAIAEGNFVIDVTVPTAGIPPYSFSIDGSGFQIQTVPFSIPNLSSGIHTIEIKDMNGCGNPIISVPILVPLSLTPTIIAEPSCAVIPDGEVSVSANGGSNNYTYNIDGGPFGVATIFNGIAPGLHTMGVHDVTSGCEFFTPITLTAATPITGFDFSMTPITCNGDSNGTITATMTTPAPGVNDNPVYRYTLTGTPLIGAPISVGPQDSPLFTGLAAGTYTVVVTSGRDCPATMTKVLGEPGTIMVPAPTVTQYGCTSGNASNFATISVDPSLITGGSNSYLNYEFVRNGTRVYFGPNNSYTEADLLGGNYVVKVYDSKGCSGSIVVVPSIAEYIALDKVSVAVNNAITCPTLEDITVTVSTIGGIPANIEYTLVDNNATTGVKGGVYPAQTNTTGIFTGLPVADYLITVKNLDTKCEIQAVHYVNDPRTFDLIIDNVVNVTCSNANDGSAEVTFIDRAISATDPDQAGAFDYIIQDSALIPNIVQSGSSLTKGPIPITGLVAGTYKITATLKNSPYCPVSRSFTITGPTAALKVSEILTEITCRAADSGSISATAVGGWPGGYEYQLSGPVNVAYSANSVFKNLTAGNYIVSVRDSGGCENPTLALTLKDPTPISFTIPADISLTCHGDTNASITVGAPTDGQGSNYSYTLNRTSLVPVISSAPKSTPVFTDLGAGTYTITVTDGWGCSTTSTPITITEPNVIVASLVKATSQTCTVQTTLALSATGGTAPYEYSPDGIAAYLPIPFPANKTTFSVPVGTYHYYVRDANGCFSIVSNDIKIDILPALNVAVNIVNSKINCKGDRTGVIVATATGGLGNYVYTLLNGAGSPLAFVPTQVTPGNFTQLPVGSYIVHVDSGDCTKNSITVDINEPPAKLDFTSTKTDVKCAGNGDGSITVTGFGGTGIIKYAITPRSDKFLDSGVFTNLKPGAYTVIIQDENGCYLLLDEVISEPNPISSSVVLGSQVQEYCAGDKTGAFKIDISGGVGPYSTSLDNSNGTYVVGQVDFAGLTGGSHTVYIKDANSCTFDLIVKLDDAVTLDPKATPTYDCVNDLPANKVTVTIDPSNKPADVVYSLDSSVATQTSNVFTNLVPGDHFIMAHHKNGCSDATAVFNVKQVDPLAILIDLGGLNEIIATTTGGSGIYSYSVNGEDIGANNKYIYYKSGDYTVTVTDSNGCVAAVTKYFEFIDIIIPPIFTPTGDGTNDNWKPNNTENYPDIKFVVYDRYGRIVGTFGAGQFWDGKYNGTELPMGDYWYVLKLRNTKDDREFVGHFTLYR